MKACLAVLLVAALGLVGAAPARAAAEDAIASIDYLEGR